QQLSNGGKLYSVALSGATPVRRDEGEIPGAEARFVERGCQRSPRCLLRHVQARRRAARKAGGGPDGSDYASASRARTPQRPQDECGGTVAGDEAIAAPVERPEGRRSLLALRQEAQRVQLEQSNERAPDTSADH